MDKKFNIYKFTGSKLFLQLFSYLMLALQLIIALLYCTGIYTYFGSKMTVVKSVELLFGIFHSKGAVYRSYFGSALAVLYFLIMIFIIKKIISTVHSIKSVSVRIEKGALSNYAVLCGTNTADMAFWVSVLVFGCSWLKNYSLSKGAVAVLIIGFLSFVLARILFLFNNEQTLLSVLTYSAHTLITFVAIFIALMLFKQPIINDIAYSIPWFFTIKDASLMFLGIVLVAKNILLFVTGILLFKFLHLILCDMEMGGAVRIKKSRKLLVLTAVTAVITLLPHMITYGTLDFDTLYAFVSPCLTQLFIFTALCVCSYFEISKEGNFKAKKVDSYEVDSKGVLIIPSDVTRIYENQFCDRRDIAEVYIHAGVTEIQKNAFAGCGALNVINCEAAYRPEGWAIAWNGSFARVHWNYKKESEAKATEAGVETLGEGSAASDGT